MILIGIDPGLSGGIACLLENGAGIVGPMPKTERDIEMALSKSGPCKALIEKVHSFPDQGVSSTFKFGMNYGFLRGCLTALKVPFDQVTPRKWQGEFGLVFPKAMNLTITEKKNRHKELAQQLFPHFKVTHATADALLIAEYLRRREMK
jgi:crossover junction endodeoxyribonuclease RuvC